MTPPSFYPPPGNFFLKRAGAILFCLNGCELPTAEMTLFYISITQLKFRILACICFAQAQWAPHATRWCRRAAMQGLAEVRAGLHAIYNKGAVLHSTKRVLFINSIDFVSGSCFGAVSSYHGTQAQFLLGVTIDQPPWGDLTGGERKQVEATRSCPGTMATPSSTGGLPPSSRSLLSLAAGLAVSPCAGRSGRCDASRIILCPLNKVEADKTKT